MITNLWIYVFYSIEGSTSWWYKRSCIFNDRAIYIACFHIIDILICYSFPLSEFLFISFCFHQELKSGNKIISTFLIFIESWRTISSNFFSYTRIQKLPKGCSSRVCTFRSFYRSIRSTRWGVCICHISRSYYPLHFIWKHEKAQIKIPFFDGIFGFCDCEGQMVPMSGLEPPTSGLWVPCSNQLSYIGEQFVIIYNGCGGVNRTHDLKVMSLASYHCSTPRYGIYGIYIISWDDLKVMSLMMLTRLYSVANI